MNNKHIFSNLIIVFMCCILPYRIHCSDSYIDASERIKDTSNGMMIENQRKHPIKTDVRALLFHLFLKRTNIF